MNSVSETYYSRTALCFMYALILEEPFFLLYNCQLGNVMNAGNITYGSKFKFKNISNLWPEWELNPDRGVASFHHWPLHHTSTVSVKDKAIHIFYSNQSNIIQTSAALIARGSKAVKSLWRYNYWCNYKFPTICRCYATTAVRFCGSLAKQWHDSGACHLLNQDSQIIESRFWNWFHIRKSDFIQEFVQCIF